MSPLDAERQVGDVTAASVGAGKAIGPAAAGRAAGAAPPVPVLPPVPAAPPVPPPRRRCRVPPHEVVGDAELRGATVPLLKSAALLSVSVQPAAARSAALVLSSVAVGPLPSKLVAEIRSRRSRRCWRSAGNPCCRSARSGS